MSDFGDLEPLYKHLDIHALDYKYPHQIGREFQRLRDLKNTDKESEVAEKAQWEVDFFNFRLKEGELNRTFSGTNEKGEAVEYPSLDRFDDEAFQYLIDRLNSTSNHVLNARYAHILWASPKKHAKYGKIAVDSYLELARLYEGKDKEEPEKHHGLDVLEAIENAYAIAYRLKYRTEDLKSEVIRLVKEFNFDSSSSFALRANLIRLMLQGRRRFSRDDFDGFQGICLKLSDTLTKNGNVHAAIDMLELGEKVDEKTGVKDTKWRKRIAESYELLIRQRGDQDLASLSFCQDALENYRRIGDQKKTEELEKKYAELKGSVKLAKFEQKIDLTDHLKRCREIAERIAKKPAEEVIRILMGSKGLLPRYDDMKRVAAEHGQKFVMQHIAPVEVLDQSVHPSQHFGTDEEKEYYGILQQYDFDMKLNKIHLITAILFTAIREMRLTAENVLELLNKYSWYGKNISKELPNAEKEEYNWLNLLAPAVHDYFNRLTFFFVNAKNYPNFVLCVDSLVLKFEGLFRDICQFCGVPTFFITGDTKGRKIVREKDIHALLYEEPVKNLIDKDDLLFFKFLLVEKAGLNLRHKIAHSLMRFEEYSIEYMNLLFLALLRLGKYDFVEKAENEE